MKIETPKPKIKRLYIRNLPSGLAWQVGKRVFEALIALGFFLCLLFLVFDLVSWLITGHFRGANLKHADEILVSALGVGFVAGITAHVALSLLRNFEVEVEEFELEKLSDDWQSRRRGVNEQ